MAPQKDALQDDYYAQVKTTQSSDDGTKKPLKLKLKAVVKKTTESEEAPEKEAPIASPVQSEEAKKEEVTVEKPKARLVEREHASEGLLRSVMRNKDTTTTETRSEEKKKPAISFSKAPTMFKPLENRPVMQLPPEEARRGARGPRRDQNTQNKTTESSANNTNGQHRLRDDVKPMFQRDIGFATPTRDGTAKKAKKGKDGNYEEGKKRGVKTLGGSDDGGFHRGHKVNNKKKEKSLEEVKQVLVDRTGQEVSVSDVISVKEFSDKIGVPVAKVIGELMKN